MYAVTCSFRGSIFHTRASCSSPPPPFPPANTEREEVLGSSGSVLDTAAVIDRVSSAAPGDCAPSPERTRPHKLFVGGLSWNTNDSALRMHFGMFGPIHTGACPFPRSLCAIVAFRSISDSRLLPAAAVMRYRDSGQSRGFGFVTFVSSAGLALALSYPLHVIDGRRVEVKLAVPKSFSRYDHQGMIVEMHNESSIARTVCKPKSSVPSRVPVCAQVC